MQTRRNILRDRSPARSRPALINTVLQAPPSAVLGCLVSEVVANGIRYQGFSCSSLADQVESRTCVERALSDEVLWLSSAVQNPQHFDAIIGWPVIDHVVANRRSADTFSDERH